jgi:hypothetical protein
MVGHLPMYALSRRSLLASSIGLIRAPRPEAEEEFRLETAQHRIRMSLEYHDGEPNRGLRFEDRSTERHFCLSPGGDENRNCIEDFQGSVAVMRYRIEPRVQPQGTLSLREYVRSIDQSDSAAPRPPFTRVIEVRGGVASDIQVYGYRTSSGQRAAPDESWCLLRQDLYLYGSGTPFLVVHWKHTVSRIRVLDMIPQQGTRVIESARR